MKKENINKLLPAVAVFSFVAFAFAITNTFGNAYAVYSCTDGWEYDETNKACCPSGYTYVDGQCMGKSVENQCSYGVQTEDQIDGFDCTIASMAGQEIVYTAHLTTYSDKDANMYENGSTTAIKEKTLTCKPTEIGGECAVSTSGLEVKKEGYTFTGWGTSLSCTEGKTTILTLTSEEKVDYYPCFQKNGETLTATFDANDGTLKGEATKSCTLVGDGTKCTITNLPAAERDGYTFMGWLLRTESATCEGSEKTSITLTESKTYHACWIKNASEDYTISMYPNGGKITHDSTNYEGNKVLKITVTVGETVKLDEYGTITGEKDGSELIGWSETSECKTLIDTTKPLTKTSYYACYKEKTNTKYTATFKPNGGTWADKTTTDKIIKDYTGRIYFTDERLVITAPDSTKEWCGWKNSDGEVWTEYIENENTTLTAQWCAKETTEPTKYTATFDANGGTISGNNKPECTLNGTATSCAVTAPTASRENYTFAGWSTTKDDASTKVTTFTLSKNTNYYALWTKNSYKVTFNLDGGKLHVDGNESASTEVKLSEVDPGKYTAKKDGHTFKGWRTSSETCDSIDATKKIDVKSDMTLTACYTEDEKETPKYKVTFSVDGGKLFVDKKESTSLTIALEEVDYSKYTAEKDGYKFLGWSNVKGSCDTPVKEGKVEIKEDTSIKACYEKVEDKEDEKEEEKPTTDKTEEEVDKTPQTGSTILYLVFLMAILSLVYTGYYSYRYIKSRM